MHNCKSTQDAITELLLDGATTPSTPLLAELRVCNRCREEFDAVKRTLRVSTTMIESATPADEYWPSYHARLKEKLDAASLPVVKGDSRLWFSWILTTSVRVPVPVAVAVLVMLVVSLFLATRVSAPPNPLEPSIVKVPVEVPVIQEKVVTRTVYRDRYRLPMSRKVNQTSRNIDDSTVARSQTHDVAAPTLVGFKPLAEIKLTVIKGGNSNEK
jgi:hypothetical protein